MIPQRSWPSGISNYGKQDLTALCGWWALMPIAVALSTFAYSSHGFASDAASRATYRPPVVGSAQTEDHAQLISDPAEQRPAAFPYPYESQKDLASLIKLLVSGPGRTELAANVGKLLLQGDLTGAQQMLSAALDVGTLAVFIVDVIQDPEVQGTLQAIAREHQGASLDSRVYANDAGVGGAKGGEPRDAAERERAHADAALQELHAAQEQLAASREKETRVAELELALELEKERTASAMQDLGHVREQLAAMAQEVTRAADTRDEYEREVKGAKTALMDLTMRFTAAQEQLASLKQSAAEAVELRATLERGNDAAASSAREMAALKEQLATLQTSRVDTVRPVSTAVQEKEQADAASQQLNAVRGQLSTFREREAKMQSELEQEKERSASATRQLDAFQKENLSLKNQAALAVTIQDALRQEKENTAAARRDVQVLKRQIADLEARTEFVPAALLFQSTPVSLKPSSHIFQGGAKPSGGFDTEGDVSQRKARQASFPPQIEMERKLSDGATAQIRRRNLPLKSVEEQSAKPPSGSLKPREAAGRDAVVKLRRSSRLPARENSATDALAPGLPASLLPINGLWALY
jgi:hypothetical protein